MDKKRLKTILIVTILIAVAIVGVVFSVELNAPNLNQEINYDVDYSNHA